MRVIFIGAGRGSRLMPTTENEPKCFARVQDKRILDWNLEAFAENEITDFCFIGGYLIDTVRDAYPHFTFRHNDDWENNNILASLMYAEDLMNEPFICCYSDTLYSANLIAGIAASDHNITLSVDTGWAARHPASGTRCPGCPLARFRPRRRWSRRFDLSRPSRRRALRSCARH